MYKTHPCATPHCKMDYNFNEFVHLRPDNDGLYVYIDRKSIISVHYKNSVKHGVATVYDPKGQLLEKAFYEYGQMVGEYISYDENGDAICSLRS